MTSEEKQEIINAVLAAIRTNSQTIDQLTPVSEMSDTDFLELNGGRKVSYGVLFANHMSNDEAQEAWEYLDTHKVDKDSRGLVEVHQAPVIYLDAMGVLDGHSLNGGNGLEYRTDTKLIYDFPGGLFGAPKAGAVYISKNNFKKFVWNGTDLEELKVDECPLFVDYSEPVAFATLPVGGSYYVPSSHKIAVKIDASNTKTYDPLPDALYFFRDKGKVYTWNSSTNKWVPVSSDINVVNNLTEGGEADALSAEMGKKIRQNISILLNRLGNYAFPNGKPTLDWSGGGGGDDPDVPTYSVNKTIGTGLSATGGDDDVSEGASLEVTIAITNNLYIIDEDNIEVTMGGSPVSDAYNAATGKITIAEVYGEVVINVPSLTYVSSGLVLMFDGKNQGETAGQWQDSANPSRSVALTGGYTQNSDNVQLDGTGYGMGSFVDNVTYDVSTAECVFKQSASVGNGQVILLLGKIGSPILAQFITNSTTRWSSHAKGVPDTFTGNRSVYAYTGSTNNLYAISYYGNNMCQNGNKLTPMPGVTTQEDNYNVANHQGKTAVGAQITGGGDILGFKGNLYCVRLYNRVLTDAEVQQNWKVDQKRFNI